MTKRNERIEYLLTPRSQKRLRRVWAEFHATLEALSLAEDPVAKKVLRALAEKLRQQMPPGGLSWPWWEYVLRSQDERAERHVRELTYAVDDAGSEPTARPIPAPHPAVGS